MISHCISINDIDFAYDKQKIYNSFSLDIDESDVLFIMGTNGCGKTTLLKIIGSFLKVQRGSITVNGKNLYSYDSKSLARTISYVPQLISLASDFLVKDYLALGRTPYKGFCEALNAQDYLIVEHYAVEMGVDSYLDKEFSTLSGGQKQNVAICRALVQETPIIIMDEPMSALDMGKQAEFMSIVQRLRDAGKTIILTSHNPNHALYLNSSVCLIHDGIILGKGAASDVLIPENIAKVYGNKVQIIEYKGQRSLVFDF